MLNQKDLSDIPQAWNLVLKALGGTGMEIQAVSRRDGYGCFFHARSKQNSIQVEPSAENTPSCNISTTRTITFEAFERVAKNYNPYARGVKGVRETIRDTCGWNSSYILSIIHKIL